LPENAPSAAGDGIPAPFGWSIIKDAVGWAWPDGHQDQLNATATAWHTASSDFRTIAGSVQNAVDLLNNQQSPEIEVSVQTCNDRKTDLNALADACQTLGDACGDYAHHLDEAHHKILDELKEFALETAAWEAGAAILIPLTGSLSEWIGNSALAGRVAIRARRIATIIADLAAAAAKIITDAIAPLIERLKPLLERIRKWVEAAKIKLSRGAAARSTPAQPAVTDLKDLFASGQVPKASDIEKYAQEQGWTKSQTENGPIKYTDQNGVIRITLKKGSGRTPGSENPHVEIRNSDGLRTDPFGNPVTRKSPGNHTSIDWDLP
jgi:hypothetical protein